MIDHLSVGVSDIEAAEQFYDNVLSTIGLQRLAALDGIRAYGGERIEFLAMLPFDKGEASFGNGTHIAFKARSDSDVDAFHAAALSNGGSDEGSPGPRPYPHAEVYAAYVRDPFGNKLEVLRGGFAP